MEFDSSTNADYSSGEENDDEDMLPGSPLSQSSRLSHASSFSRYDRSNSRKIRWMISYALWAIKFVLCLPLLLFRSIKFGRHEARSSDVSTQTESSSIQREKSGQVKDHLVRRTTDRRRGVIEVESHMWHIPLLFYFEFSLYNCNFFNLLSFYFIYLLGTSLCNIDEQDLQLAIEIFIEGIFQFFHKAAHFLLSPREAYRTMWRWYTSYENRDQDFTGDVDIPVPSATLADGDPGLTERHSRLHQSLNMDSRTCEDVIREHG